MAQRHQATYKMITGLLDSSHLMTLDQLPVCVTTYAAAAGLHDILIYLCDVRQDVLRLLTGSGPGTAGPAGTGPPELSVDSTLAGRGFQHGEVLLVPRTGRERPGERQWWVPLLDGTERLGMMRVTAASDDAHTRRDIECLASLIALIIVTKSVHSDSHAALVRTRPMNVAAEMQWQLMPPRAYADSHVVIGAAMEPAYENAGDAYDYATTDGLVHLAIFDAMGHDTAAGLTANLAVAACRSHRRRGAGLIETGEGIERTLLDHLDRSYVTAVLATLDTRTGLLTWISHGHHPPVVIRGGRWTTQLNCPPAPPLGTALGLPATLCRERLQPGDRLVLHTDGITEARDSDGREFGLDGFLDFLLRHHADNLSVPETLRRLVRSILDRHHGTLRDDATVLLLEWHGPTPFDPGEAETLVGLPE
ncbi:PP2C family protein-serine/threonine phosphatase [Streptomyces sp. NPDC014685]|uniref:PP2C family protein-serine/threonine phosphatase n=1 Tax=Streptomyces sp. NPDC014685 TaxID=3364881 RepID=UPI0037018061